MRLKRVILREIYNFLQKHYFLTTLILGMSPIWYAILKIGEKASFLNAILYQPGNAQKEELKIEWLYFTYLMVVVNIIIIYFKALADNKNMISQNEGQAVYRKVLTSLHFTSIKKVQRLKDFIGEKGDLKHYSAFKSITKPVKQIEILTDNLVETLITLCGMDQNDLSASLYYKNRVC